MQNYHWLVLRVYVYIYKSIELIAKYVVCTCIDGLTLLSVFNHSIRVYYYRYL